MGMRGPIPKLPVRQIETRPMPVRNNESNLLPPEHMNPEVLVYWNYFHPRLVELGRLNYLTLKRFNRLCECLAERDRLWSELTRNLWQEMNLKNVLREHPLSAVYFRLNNAIERLESDFGISFTSDKRLEGGISSSMSDYDLEDDPFA